MHCGYTEDQIDDMSYIFYKDVIAEIALQLNYTSVVHLLGRDYSDKNIMKTVQDSNPFFVDTSSPKKHQHERLTYGTLQKYGLLKN